MKTLTIDTSTNTLGISVLNEREVIGELTTQVNNDHSTRLMPAIVSLMDRVSVKPKDLTQIIVGKGPGSYTGVRIAVTTAKSLGWTLDIPVYAVSSLQLLSYNGRFFKGLICPFFDARRQNVYTGLYEWKDKKIQVVQKDSHVSMEAWLEELAESNEQILFLSPNISQYESMIFDKLEKRATIAEQTSHFISPRYLLNASIGRDATNVHQLSPNYIRLVEAEVNWLKQQEGAQ